MTIVTGFKATDHNMQCRGYQFTPGEWHECEGELELCGNGFHFCKHPSGPWAYYSDRDTRIWKVEADGVLADGKAPGADYKLVARRIRLVEEVLFDGNRNTGNRNTGHGNSTNYSAGYFCQNEPTVVSFDVDTGMHRQKFVREYGEVANQLSSALMRDEPIEFESFSSLPGITPEKLLSLHAKFKEARNKQ